jgi:hypothetical protein
MPLDAEPIGQNNPTPNAERKPDAQQAQGEPDVPRTGSIPPAPPTKTHCEITCKTEKDFWDHVKTGAEILGIILLAIYTGYTIKMYCANKKAADAAKSAADTAHDAFVKGTRPWLGVDGPLVITSAPVIETLKSDMKGYRNVRASYQFTVKNFGTAPALHYAQNSTIVINSPPTPDGLADFSQFKNDADAACRLAESGTRPVVPGEEGSGLYLFPQQPITERTRSTSGSPDVNEKRALDIVGCLVYSDQHKTVHHTRFCFMGNTSIMGTKAGDKLEPCPINQYAD